MTIRIALIDSGVDRNHPHVRAAGRLIDGGGVESSGALVPGPQVDRLGHGTCAAAAILDLAPGSEITSFQVFRDEPCCPFQHVLLALDRALDDRPYLINLSLGTTESEWKRELLPRIDRARDLGVRLVSPASFQGFPSYPGCLSGVDGVLMDARLPREKPELREEGDHRYWYASPYPRDLPGLPRAANLAGVSLACANVTGYLARRRSSGGREIREATLDDGAAIEALFARALTPLRDIYRPKEESHPPREGARRVVCVIEGKIVGTASYCVRDGVWCVFGVATDPVLQRRGVCRSLIAEVADRARANGLEKLRIHTIAETGNLLVFERCGFRVVDSWTPEWCVSPKGETLTELRMELDLTAV